jgi:hypothetical protein
MRGTFQRDYKPIERSLSRPWGAIVDIFNTRTYVDTFVRLKLISQHAGLAVQLRLNLPLVRPLCVEPHLFPDSFAYWALFLPRCLMVGFQASLPLLVGI